MRSPARLTLNIELTADIGKGYQPASPTARQGRKPNFRSIRAAVGHRPGLIDRGGDLGAGAAP
jgi:hypothetical protein